MKAKEVLQILRISRSTLTSYCKKKISRSKVLPNGYYDYFDSSIFDLAQMINLD